MSLGRKQFLLVCATAALSLFCLAPTVSGQQAQSRQQRAIPRTRFTCVGRPSGYYADLDTGCQVYHMCDGLGRQFSYTCPNTTLFQQRMLVCDHWYMVNCSMSERDYSANLLIGQRDKPFVSDEEMRQWTPRPDILTVPANTNYYDGLKEAETKFSTHPGNSIVGIPDSISTLNNNGLDSAKVNYRPPTSWSAGTGRRPPKGDQKPQHHDLHNEETQDSLSGAASQKVVPTFRPTPADDSSKNTGFTQNSDGDSGFTGNANLSQDISFTQNTGSFTNTGNPAITPPTQELKPPHLPTTEPTSEEFEIDARMKEPREDAVIKFINRFDPNSPDSIKTAMTRSEILNINQQLPAGQSSAEDDRTPRRQKNGGGSFNKVQNDRKSSVSTSKFDTVNTKPVPTDPTPDSFNNGAKADQIPTPDINLVPPKTDYSQHSATTMGPPIYYEWKWAAPAFDLEPPKAGNVTFNATSSDSKADGSAKSPFSRVTRPTPADFDPLPPTKNTEYNISSYFVPDYIFPLDKPHPGYEDEDAQTSFQVEVARPGRSYGENPNCPQCHPAYLKPGSCEPCIVKR